MGSAILVVAVGWSIGVALAAGTAAPVAASAVATLAAALAAALLPAGGWRLGALAVAATLAGHAWSTLRSDPLVPDLLDGFDGPAVAVGRIVDAPTFRGERLELVVAVESATSLRAGPSALPTAFADRRPRILARAPRSELGYGDHVELRGRLALPRSRPGWPLAELLARRGIGRVLDVRDARDVRVVEPGGVSPTGLLAQVRAVLEANTRTVLAEPHASLVSGIVFGGRAALPPDLRAAMATTGTTHLTAVSGANVAMVAGALLLVLRGFLGPGAASLVGMAGVWAYTLLVGAPPSAVRAAAMSTCALAALGLGRQADTVTTLAVAAAAMLAWDPGLAFDLGFQLSVAATAGLVLLAPPLERALRRLPTLLRGPLAVALAAQLATLPIIVATFQRLSLVALPANVLAAPAVPPIMAAGAALALLAWLPGIGDILGWAAWAPTAALLAVITGLAAVPGGELAVGRPPGWLLPLWYAALACWVAAGSADLRALGIRPAWLVAGTVGGGLALAAPPLAGLLMPTGPPAVTLTLLDVDPPAAFVRTARGDSVLVLTGEPGFGLAASVAALAEFGETAVGVVVGPDGAQAGVDLLRLGPASLGAGGDAGDGADGSGARSLPPKAGDAFAFDGGVRIDVLDVRAVGGRPALDLVVAVEGVTVLLPGSGPPSGRWSTVVGAGPVVAALPPAALTFARLLPAQAWLVAIGDGAVDRLRGEAAVPLLDRREHGQVEIAVSAGTVSIRTERCAAGRECDVVLPPPAVGPLLARP